ncbi:hypothetical protein [Rathayibacter sp. Leaf299]|uniref:hypothetical protein n=1 Tax=Rathayibacter sp. Leaf299 TaxID=1736328 RepID=UPI0009E708D7|nr:hypothetical protein [Rathayibacter sp. Leaf299]
MPLNSAGTVADSLTLRFDGEEANGDKLHELRASHVAEVLQGIVGLTSDFDKAGVFDADGPAGSEILVRPAQEGSFLIEVVRVVSDSVAAVSDTSGALGIPTVGAIIYWATKSARADVKDYEHLDNGQVKIIWQDDTVDEVPAKAWQELKVRKRRRKKHLRQIMAPLSDARVTSLDVALEPTPTGQETPEVLILDRAAYEAVKPQDDVEEIEETFEREARMSAIDFDDATRWKVKTREVTRGAAVEDAAFLKKVAEGLAIRKDDIFNLRIRENRTITNGSSRSTWTVLKVTSHRRAAGDDDA